VSILLAFQAAPPATLTPLRTLMRVGLSLALLVLGACALARTAL
jgi:hypothetical protein